MGKTFTEKAFRNLGLSEEECRKRATEALRHVGMEERYFEQSPFDLSGGQKRRAAIAGVLAMRPEILVLDEPTAGLDPRGRDEILGLITDMKKQLHMTILLVSHSMDDVARYADRIMVMRRGKLVYNDVPAEIFKHSAELEEMGLSAPQITYIMEYLQTRGLRVNADMLTVYHVRTILSDRLTPAPAGSPDQADRNPGLYYFPVHRQQLYRISSRGRLSDHHDQTVQCPLQLYHPGHAGDPVYPVHYHGL